MGYDHSLTATIRLRTGVTEQEVAAAIKPLTKHYDLDEENLFGVHEANLAITINQDGDARYLDIYTAGDASCDYVKIVKEVAANLSVVTDQAGEIVLSDYDTADLDNNITSIAYGPSQEAIVAFRRESALNGAMNQLSDVLGDNELVLVRGLAERLMKSKQDVAPVAYCDSERYNRDSGLPAKTPYLMEVEDQRTTSGQLRVALAAEDGGDSDQLDAFFEVGRLNHGEADDDLPCMHLAFDADNLAFSAFKQGDRFILRPENGVTIEKVALDSGEKVWIVE
ncbi:MAG: hypothetical protein K8L99_04195 [Anaerolineae bacterium]|nr:hypothetical protein [Anaerolineae bacterium]MCZ2113647.1 hypothetical protein [Anaerolineae bacterium]